MVEYLDTKEGEVQFDTISSKKFLITDLKDKFEETFGIPYNPSNYGNIRNQFVLNADVVIALKLNDEESFAVELLQRIMSKVSHGVAALIARHTSAKPLSDNMLALKDIHTHSHIETAEFENFETLITATDKFLSRSEGFISLRKPKLGTTLNTAKFDKKSQKGEIFSSISNVDILGTSYSDRFLENKDSRKHGVSNKDSFKKATLHVKSGLKMTGYSFGADVSRTGEVVFQTAMIGYPECLSDPSYRDQILVCSSTILGQYGVPQRTRDRYGLLEKFESEDIHIAGLVITDYSFNYSHFEAFQSLSAWLKKYNIPAIYGWEVDTRALILELRKYGSSLGKLVVEGDDETKYPYEDPNERNLVGDVSVKEPVYFEGGPTRIILVDFGVKNNIIRCLLDRGVSLLVVPWNYELGREKYDGIMLSNGPGDPQLMSVAINNLRKEMTKENPVPIMGVCMGNQVLGIAAGAKTYKLAYGNRGHNQPVVDLTTGKTYITSQNHGYAINAKLLPPDWTQYFMNLNDHTNEGIRHITKPWFSAQFHPEANGGPWDTRFLFDIFIHNVVQRKYLSPMKPFLKVTVDEEHKNELPGVNHLRLDENGKQKLISPYKFIWKKKNKHTRKVLVIGSGPLQIGQAGEFDYSGCQAISTLREEGIQSVLVNPNIATVQTKVRGLADTVYLSPLTVESVTEIIKKERPDGVFLGFGGQTALNLGVRLDETGVFAKYGVQVLGTPIRSIQITEDRELFNAKLMEINEPIAKGAAACTIEDAINVAKNIIGYPVILRAAFALGGLGSGFAENDDELVELCKVAFVTSPQVLIEKDLRGWKELEYEVVRDMFDNCFTPAALENINPMGIHTGESIVVCPLQTVTDEEHFRIRNKAIKIIKHLGVVGECNIQFALNPNDSNEIYVIEVNARLSRSSALASKATCYPLAYIAAKLMLGYPLPAVTNNVTGITSANFEPSLDYVVIKIPRWDMVKFNGVSRKLGSMMKSVGEIMAIGRTFEEAMQKGLRMIDPNQVGLHFSSESRAREEFKDLEALEVELKKATDRQIFAIYQALKQGVTVKRIWQLSRIDQWFLSKFKKIVDIENVISSFSELKTVPEAVIKDAKDAGFSDRQIAKCFKGVNELQVREYRKSKGIIPYVKKIDTLAGEFPCDTNNLYLTYNAHFDEVNFKEVKKGIVILGGGCYRIGSSVEFDWCSVEFIKQLQNEGASTIMINNNPETVSTDHTMSDRLYFEELNFERVMDIYEKENPHGVCVSYGGQLPQNIALKLESAGAKILGHSSDSIDRAENRIKFSQLLNDLKVDQPEWAELTDMKAGIDFAAKVGYPVICRPSYVLSGAAMRLVNSEDELKTMLISTTDVSPEHPVCISKFQPDSMEVEFDGVAQNGKIIVYAISHHVENAGVHSGDATLVFPNTDLNDEAVKKLKEITKGLAETLKVNGPFNIQYLYKDNIFKVIELNLRASRSFPFVCKVMGLNFMRYCAKLTLGQECTPVDCDPKSLGITHVGVKAPKFSYKRLLGSDPLLGLEMASTGEIGTIGVNKHVAFLKSYQSTGDFVIPKKGTNVLISCDFDHELEKFMKNKHLSKLANNYNVYIFTDHKGDIPGATRLNFKQTEEMIMDKKFSLFLSFTRPLGAIFVDNDFAKVRKRAIQFVIPAFLNEQLGEYFTDAIYDGHDKLLKYDRSLQEYLKIEEDQPNEHWK